MDQLLTTQDKLEPRGTTEKELDSFKYSNKLKIDKITFLELEKVTFELLEGSENDFERRLGGIGKLMFGLEEDLENLEASSRTELIQELKNGVLPETNTYTKEHLTLLGSFLNYRKNSSTSIT